MTDVRTQPLIAEQGAIRVDPYSKQSSSDPSLASLPPSMARTVGSGTPDPSSPSANPDANGDGTLDAEELGHLQDAAANGDKESWDLLNALKLPLGIAAGAAALYGAARGGLALTDAVAKANGANIMGGQRTDGVTVDPNDLHRYNAKRLTDQRPPIPQQQGAIGQENRKLLPQPQGKIADTTGSRFNQSAPTPQKSIPDMNKTGREVDAAYAQRDAVDTEALSKAELQKSLATAKSMRLRGALNSAAKAVGKIH